MQPQMCPFCGGTDLRPLPPAADSLYGWRCHACQRAFYTTSLRTKPAEDKTEETPTKRKRGAPPT